MTTPQHAPWLELQVIRGKDGMSLKQLSILSGIAKGHLSDLENGKRKPTAHVIAEIAKALNVPRAVLEPRTEPLSANEIERVLAAREERVA